MNFVLKRVAYLPDETLGVLLVDNIPKFTTLEDPWKDNAKNISCIPTGNYTCSRYQSGKFGPTYIVDHVPGRSGILFHKGNTNKETQGCILVGRSYGTILESPAIISSYLAFNDLLSILEGIESFSLKIESC